ncbi:hypothetical protein [Burkholderia gladioli]|uniref:hypothetical protein n=1 Tax=Burkholderia gladioli TaxID=28095 RepID=UPI0034DADF2C
MSKRKNTVQVTPKNKPKGIKDRRNILPIEDIEARISYDPIAGSFSYTHDCKAGASGADATWRFKRTDSAGTPYESTTQWELVKFDDDHWYEPKRLAWYFINREWPPAGMWVAGGGKYDYRADGLELRDDGDLPAR